MKLLNGKTVLITGAASGIGYETALSFASRGSDLVITDINERALAAVRDEITATGVKCLAKTCDVANEDSVTEFAASVTEVAGALDLLVNNAGIAFLGAFEETRVVNRLWRAPNL